MNDTLSTMSYINCGVPQGSILGPLLFPLYINDIIESTKVLKFYPFADDTTIFSYHKPNINSNHIINDERQHVTELLAANKLSLNVSKSSFLNFTLHKQTPNNIKLDNLPLLQKNVTK